MKLYRCVFSNDELCSDSYEQLAPFGDDSLFDVAFELKGRRIPAPGTEDYGIGDPEEQEGGNDAEDAAGSNTVIDLQENFNLSPTGFSKKSFGVYLKGYMGKLKQHLQETDPSRVDAFMQGAKTLASKLMSMYEELSMFTGESMDDQGTLVYSYYKDQEETPRFIYIKDGLKEEKC